MKIENKNQSKPVKTTELSRVLIKLLQGSILFEDRTHWESLLLYQDSIKEYVALLGLQLHVQPDEGYAFLRPLSVERPPSEEENPERLAEGLEEDQSGLKNNSLESPTPSLARRFPLSFEVSLLCVLIREALEQFDSKISDDHRLILNRNEIYDLLRFFYEEKTDETKQTKRFDALISRVIELGFLKELKGNAQSFEVRRIIKALIDAEKLAHIKQQMLMEVNKGSDGHGDRNGNEVSA